MEGGLAHVLTSLRKDHPAPDLAMRRSQRSAKPQDSKAAVKWEDHEPENEGID